MTQNSTLQDIYSLKKVHIIGVCGTLMGAFAAYLKRRGIEVTGSDQNVYPPMSDVLREAGVKLFSGYRPENLVGNLAGNLAENLTENQVNSQGRPDLVVIGNVISSNNPEACAAIEGGYLYSSLPEAMERLFLNQTQNLVVAGTHGKTTTSSLLAHTLIQCKKKPSYFIGGVSLDLPFSFHVEDLHPGAFFVLEGDEYDTAFWDKVPKFNHYLPDHVILTSVEYDHADIYPDFQAVVRAFEGLMNRVRQGGQVIACMDYASVRDLVRKAKVPVLTYGSPQTEARFTPGKTWMEGERTLFEVCDHKKVVAELAIQIPGMHNILNSLSVWVECQQLKLEPEAVATAFRSFRGVKRRQEVRGEVQGVLVIDDFAHHPTAVRETLRALRLKYPKRRLLAVFEPRSATSRRKVFQNDYATAFQEADLVWIAKPYDQSRIPTDQLFSSEMLVEDLSREGRDASLIESVEDGVKDVARKSRSGDLIAVLSNGGFGGFIPKLLEELLNLQSRI